MSVVGSAADTPEAKRTRRRGGELEAAILDAAWEQLTAEGYEHFTVDTVAARAQTGKSVLYRRWRTREELLTATARHRGSSGPEPEVPDTGSLREDLMLLLRQANERRGGLAAMFSAMLGSFYDEGGPSLSELREAFLGGRSTRDQTVIDRAAARGEIDPDKLTPRIRTLPFDLLRHELMMTLRPTPDHVLRQIVDDIFIPLVRPDSPPPRPTH